MIKKTVTLLSFLSILITTETKAAQPDATEHKVTYEVRKKPDGTPHFMPIHIEHKTKGHAHNAVMDKKLAVPAEKSKTDAELLKQPATKHVVTYHVKKNEQGHAAEAKEIKHDDPNHENATLFSLFPGSMTMPSGAPSFLNTPMMINGPGCSGSSVCS
ncbi:MAG: hypothetical protein Q8K37_08540 [Alphaproteobacteria bacterium]|nr:hypothetical protein [Alphaproteobacteria bacterium]